MEDAALKNMHCYRVGGDEFIVICVSTSEDLVIDYIADVKKRLTETRYTCSIGYSYTSNNTTILEMKRIADEKMYSDKSRHYESLREKN